MFSDSRLTLVSSFLSTAIKVNCQGACGITNKLNDTSWALEEQYFNSTLSVADKGDDRKTLMALFVAYLSVAHLARSLNCPHQNTRCMNGDLDGQVLYFICFSYFPGIFRSSFIFVHTIKKLNINRKR